MLRRAVIGLIIWLGNVHRRLLAVCLAAVGPRAAYAATGVPARLLYRLLPLLRERGEAHCRAALAARVPPPQIPRIAERSFVHRIWNLTDLMLAERLLLPTTYHRYGGRIPATELAQLRQAQARRQPLILVSAYYGPFDLLPLFMGFQGIRAGVVYQPHENAAFDAYRRRIRARGGCELIPVAQALERLPRILQAGGTIAVVADHHARRHGLPVTFLGLPTLALRTVGLLAERYGAEVIVAGIRRLGNSFGFAIMVKDVIRPAAWSGEPDAVRYITQRYLRAFEQLVYDDPTQYPWAYARWGEDFARQLTPG